MFLARTPAKKAPTPPRPSTSGAGASNRAETKVPTPNASTQASCVRRSIGEWENGRLAESQPPCPAALSPPVKAVKVPAAPLKNSRKAAPQPDPRAVARRISTDETEASPGTSRMQPQNSTDRVTEARNLLVRVKSLLGESRNLRTDIKTGLIQAVERLYQLVKEQAAANKTGAAEPEEKRGREEHCQHGADPAMALQAAKMEEHAELLRENTRMIGSLKEDLKRHKGMIESVIEKTAVAATYASVTKSGTQEGNGLPPRETLHSVVVTAKDDQETGENVLERVRKVMDAKEGWIEVMNVRKARDRKVIIGLSSEAEREKLKQKLETAGEYLNVEEVKNRDPLLVLRGVLRMHTDEDILKALKNQNKDLFLGLGEADNRVKIRYRRKARNPHTCHTVISVSPVIWQRATARKVVQIDLQPVRVEDQSPLVQCTRCLGYGHSKRFCTEPADLCSHCGGPHLRPDCDGLRTGSAPSCINCNKVKASNADHNAFEPSCAIRQKWDALARSTVAYK